MANAEQRLSHLSGECTGVFGNLPTVPVSIAVYPLGGTIVECSHFDTAKRGTVFCSNTLRRCLLLGEETPREIEVKRSVPAGELTRDLTTGIITLNKRFIPVSMAESAVLGRLMAQPGVPVSREELLGTYNGGIDTTDLPPSYLRAIDTCIAGLRAKLNQRINDPSSTVIETHVGKGYALATLQTERNS